jgi:hypothetical protein
MWSRNKFRFAVIGIVLLCAAPVRAEDTIEKSGTTAGLTIGNVLVAPMKAISVSMGVISGALSLLLTGNADLSRQIWRDTVQGPYVITPEVAKKAIGERPELEQE